MVLSTLGLQVRATELLEFTSIVCVYNVILHGMTMVHIHACTLLLPPFTMIAAGSLQIFSGTLTEITCSADQPVFRLVTEEGMEYDQTDYNQLPGLFDIKAVVSPDRNNVTLFVNGTNRSNNVTVMCGRLYDAIRGLTETLFTLVFEYVSKFS